MQYSMPSMREVLCSILSMVGGEGPFPGGSWVPQTKVPNRPLFYRRPDILNHSYRIICRLLESHICMDQVVQILVAMRWEPREWLHTPKR